ncbi:hypothetical protein F4Z98_06070 [Candidatus Poribacteria bacterium]|nr:hypothetical protein [Candidatus Poribacteria bacterium]
MAKLNRRQTLLVTALITLCPNRLNEALNDNFMEELMKTTKTLSIIPLIMISTLLIGIGCDPKSGPPHEPGHTHEPERTPGQQFEHWTNLLGFDILDVVKSAAWIEKHEDEISIPDSIDFMGYHHVEEFGFMAYGIFITTDYNGKYRVGKQRAFGKGWPPDKTPLKIGDKLPFSFSANDNIKWTGNRNNLSEFEDLLKNRTYHFLRCQNPVL